MAPTIHFVRHAQGYHNLSIANEGIHDPDLTPLGLQQCASLRAAFPHHDKITKLIASPMRRTLYTCLNAFGHHESLLPITAMPVFQEFTLQQCDVGSTVPDLEREFAGKAEFSQVEDAWTDKGPSSPYEPTVEKLLARGKKGRLALRDIADLGSDEHIVVVAHGGILHFLTDDWQGDKDEHATGWTNCEYRSYQFVDPAGKDEDAALQETPESWSRRHGASTRPTLTEQKELRPMMIERMSPYITVKN